jgi:hypothetical protein
MNPDVVLTLLFVTIPIALGPGLGWYRTAQELRRLRREIPAAQDAERLASIERAVDALAQQGERLAETQDFLGRIVADRLPLQVPRDRPPSPHVTPH